MRNAIGRQLACGIAVGLMIFVVATCAMANGEMKTVNYATSEFNILRIFVAGLGGVIAILGIALAFKNSGVLSNVSVSLDKPSLTMNRVSQGVIIAVAGVAILIAAMYLLPSKVSETTITGKTITTTPTGSAVKN